MSELSLPTCMFEELVDRYERGDLDVCSMGMPLAKINRAWRERVQRRQNMPNSTTTGSVPEANTDTKRIRMACKNCGHTTKVTSYEANRYGGQSIECPACDTFGFERTHD